MKTRTTYGRRRSEAGAVTSEVASAPPPAETDELLDEVIRLAREPLDLEEPAETPVLTKNRVSSEAFAAAVAAIADTHGHSTAAIREMLASATTDDEPNELVASVLDTLGKFAMRPDPPAPDIHVHTPQQDLRVTVEQPEFKPEITVERTEVTVPEREVRVDVHVPEQPAPQVTVAAATPEVVVQPGPAPVVNVNMPDEIRTIPAEVETVAERDADDLIVRSVTRPTGE